VVGLGVEVRVCDRVEEHLLHEADVAALLGQQGERRGHVAADRIAGDRDAGRVEVLLHAVLGVWWGHRGFSLAGQEGPGWCAVG
jgi:hypothetical protein